MIHVRPHDIFVRQGPHLFCELPLSFAQTALGDTVDVPVLGGTAQLTVPAGTQPGQRLTLRGKGMPQIRGRGRGRRDLRGDVEVPTRLTARQRDLLEEFHQISKDRRRLEGVQVRRADEKLFGS